MRQAALFFSEAQAALELKVSECDFTINPKGWETQGIEAS
tara:strand:- start:495 stop:614 length:120 start_codon:yes stop_codon:yes gene_type:complete